MAVLEMLARHYSLPFRRDVLEKQVRHQVRERQPSLHTLGNLATILGLQGSLSEVSEVQLPRVPVPWVTMVYGQPAIIHEVRRGQVKAVLPEYGRLQLLLVISLNLKVVLQHLSLVQAVMLNKKS